MLTSEAEMSEVDEMKRKRRRKDLALPLHRVDDFPGRRREKKEGEEDEVREEEE